MTVSDDISDYNMHEFAVSGSQQSILYTMDRTVLHNYSDISRPEVELWVRYGGFREINLRSGETIFEWSCLGHVDPDESYVPWITMNTTTLTWDFM